VSSASPLLHQKSTSDIDRVETIVSLFLTAGAQKLTR